MWVVDNNTPFPVERGFLRDLDGGEVWIVVLKATFDIRPDGRVRRSEEQVPPARAAAWTGAPGQSSLLHDTDFVLSKSGTDVLVRGHAYAPRGRSVPSVEAGFKVGSFAKRIRAYGIRAWMRGRSSQIVVAGPARPFDRVALTYEEAFGGADPRAPAGAKPASTFNPVGLGFRYQPASLVGEAAPRLEHLDADTQAGPADRPPAGFGPIAPSWAPRTPLAGTYDERWKSTRAPLWPLDFDVRFFRSAPADQQLPTYLAPRQTIELFNLTPDGYARVEVPDLSFTMRTIFTDGEEKTKAVLHTALCEPDQDRIQLCWHASLPCHGREHKLTRAILNLEGDRACLAR
jgi:hypothetical protein